MVRRVVSEVSEGRISRVGVGGNKCCTTLFFLTFRPDDEFALIVEDDLELSPFWYTWLRKAWGHYKGREDIAGITLSVSFNSTIPNSAARRCGPNKAPKKSVQTYSL